MSQEWMKFEKATIEKPEVFRMAISLGIDRDSVIGKLLRVWSYFDTQTTDGILKESSKEFLDGIIGTPGFSAAMIAVRWLVEKRGSLSLPNFDRHNGHTAKNRAMSSLRMNRMRKLKREESGYADVTQSGYADVTQMLSNEHEIVSENVTPRIEKNREEKNREEKYTERHPPPSRPTLEEIRAYCLERKNSVNPEAWFDHYTANGWKVGKNAMKDWKAAVRQWERNNFSPPTGKASFGTDEEEAAKARKLMEEQR